MSDSYFLKWNPYLREGDRDFYQTVFAFSRERIFPSVEERDQSEIWSGEIWKDIGKAGLAGLPIPVEYGGQGAGCFQCCLATEAFAAGSIDGGLGLSWSAHMIIGCMPILFQGTEEQKRKYLPKLASGEWIGGLALTEAESGSDAGSLTTRAEEVDGGFRLNGNKIYITNGPVGQVFIVMARTGSKSRGPMGISAFLVESNFPGFRVSKVLRKLGHHTSQTAELIFEDMFVPRENLLGPLHSGFLRIGKATLEWERTVLIAGVTGALEFALDYSLKYAQERRQFNKPISEFYSIREKIVKNWVWLNASRLMIYRVAKEKDLGQSLPIESSVAKLFTSEIGEDVARDTIQIFGGYGFMKEFHVERFYRDVKLATIGGGTSEIQRSIIASSFPGTEEFLQKLKSINLYLGNRESYVHRGAGELDRLQTPDYPKMEEERKSKEGKEGNLEEFAQDPDFKKLIFLIREILYELPSGFRKENQSQEFAFSDLLMTLLVIDSVLQGLPEAVSWYTNDQKARDFKLLIRLIIGKYIHSFIELAGKSDSAALVLESLKDFANSESEIQESMQFLESRFHHPALNGKEVLI